MTVNELIKSLKEEKKYGNGDLPVELFCHDHNPEIANEGVGSPCSVIEYTNEDGYNFIAVST